MVLVKKSITLTQPQDDWIKRQVEQGRYANESELVRDLIRRAQERTPSQETLRLALEEGLQSGVSPLSAQEVFARVRRRMVDGDL